ncbi:hypothetical protein C4N9_20760 [Pararhodobacter marinus]|uniref:ERF family protein n=1 Tax=Pararhodobacter marinus TaxID=2184063 RepID=A0A2U2C4G2_9RHOB|nr:ERF family protein [Pararhodobacter marinus]PWE26694.1 hypothetical protein C4N9_20760 [Pararhodobacter marinus]
MNAVTETKADHASIAAALAAAQAEMGKALKQANNPHFRSKYADLGNVMEACLPALNRHGIALIQPAGAEGDERFVETVLIHVSGERLTCRVPLIVSKNDMQGYGSAVTYARRYGLMCMAGIAPEDDDGNAAANAAPKRDERRASTRENDGFDPVAAAVAALSGAETLEQLAERWRAIGGDMQRVQACADAKERRKAALSQTAIEDDEIPY